MTDLSPNAEAGMKSLVDRADRIKSVGPFGDRDERVITDRQRLRLDAVNVAASIHRSYGIAERTLDPDVVLATAGKIIELIEGVKL